MTSILQKERRIFIAKQYVLKVLLFLGALSFASCLFFFLIPFLTSFIPAFLQSEVVSSSFAKSGKDATQWSKIFKIFLFTVFHSFLSALLSLFIGFILAFFCANRTFKMRRFILSLSSIPITFPAITIALSYILFFGNNGVFYTVLKSIFKINTPSFLYSIFGIILIQGFYNFPIPMRLISESWKRVNRSEEAVATLLGAKPFFIFKTITLPHLFPSIMASFLLVFLFCFFSFVIVLLFGGVGRTTIEVELYKCFSYIFDPLLASRLSLIEVLFSLCLLNLYSYFKGKETFKLENVEERHVEIRITGKREKLLLYFALSSVFIFLIFPLFSIFFYSFYSKTGYAHFYSFSFKAYFNLFSSTLFYRSLATSFLVGVCTVTVSIFASLFFLFLRLFFATNKSFELLSFLPLTASSIMLSFGWSMLLNNANFFILIFTQSSLFWLYAYSQISLSRANIPISLIESALLLSKSKILTFFKIVLPLIKREVISGAIFVFSMSLADASLPLALNIEDFNSLSLLLFSYASSYRFSESAIIALLLLLISSILFFVKDRF